MAHKEYIREIENSDTAVVFIHGFLGSPEHFEPFIRITPDNISVYNILLDGHGGTVRDFAKSSMLKWQIQSDNLFEKLCKKYNSIIVVAHSMGTFFAIDAAINHPDKIKYIMLLQSPLKIGVKPTAAVNTFKSLFNIFSDDSVSVAYKNAHSIKLNMRVWEYAGWIPRYIELFAKSKQSRKTITKLTTPTILFQAQKDELVSMKSVKYIPSNNNSITTQILKASAHFIYDTADLRQMTDKYSEIIEQT